MLSGIKKLAVIVVGFVLVGCGRIAAPDPVCAGESGGYRAVVYDRASEMFLAVGTGGRLDLISDQGHVRSVSVPTEEDLHAIYADEDIVLAAGTGGVMLYSEGEVFDIVDTGTSLVLLDITAFNGRYFACGEKGILLSSSDGVEWRRQRFSDNKDIIAIAATEENLMAITAQSDFYVSRDGINWSFQNYNVYYDGYFDPLVFKDIEAIDGMFYIIGHFEGDPGAPFIIRGVDGSVWVYVTITDIDLSNLESDEMPAVVLNGIAADHEQILAACDGGYVLTISNCDSCHRLTEVSKVDLRDVAFGNNKFLAVGDEFRFDVLEVLAD